VIACADVAVLVNPADAASADASSTVSPRAPWNPDEAMSYSPSARVFADCGRSRVSASVFADSARSAASDRWLMELTLRIRASNCAADPTVASNPAATACSDTTSTAVAAAVLSHDADWRRLDCSTFAPNPSTSAAP
jgi:hypothetical protein